MDIPTFDPTQLVALAANGSFAALGCYAMVSWLRRREPARMYLAATFGLLGVVAIVSLADSLVNYHLPLAEPVRIVTFLGSGIALLALRRHLVPMPPRYFRGAVWISVGVACAGILAGLPTAPGAALNPLQAVATWLIILTWAACVAEPVQRFWRESRTAPAVQRARLRALAGGYTAIVLTLVISLTAVPSRGWGGAVIQGIVAFLAPILYTAMSPPRWLARRWRASEEEAMAASIADLLSVGDDRALLGARALDWGTRMLGANGGVLAGPGGELIAQVGLDQLRAEALAVEVIDIGYPRVIRDGTHGELVAVVPVCSTVPRTVIAVVAGNLTPIFGDHELDRLRQYAVLVAAALDRISMVEEGLRTASLQGSLLQGLSDIGEGLVITEAGRMVYGNDAYVAMTGYSVEELESMPSLIALAPADERDEIINRMRTRLGGGNAPFQYESRLVTRDGNVLDVETVVRLLPADGPARIMGIVRDITERKRVERNLRESEEALRAVALTDAVTGRNNRRSWELELARAMARARRNDEPLSVALIDLDSFKPYNDDWGHQRGDRLLKDIAAAWSGALREVDFLARYGGDEFAVLLPGCDAPTARGVLERMLLNTPERQTCSVGLAFSVGADVGPDLVARADAALYRAKRENRGHLVVASSSNHDPDPGQRWGDVIPAVLEDHGVLSVYQPIVDLRDKSLLGYEALARLIGGPLDAGVEDLFAAAAKLGFSRDLDWLCRRAAFEGADGIGNGVLLFVNVGAGALLDPVHGVDQMLLLTEWVERTPGDFVFEISERDLIRDATVLSDVLATYRSEGFRFAVDDVGEGFSTLEVLAAASPEFIKLGRSMIAENGARRAVVEAILTFAATTDAQVIAEGLEDRDRVEQAAAMGVQFGQGWALGRPSARPALR